MIRMGTLGAPAPARWTGGLQVVSSHLNGVQVVSDMRAEFGGTGSKVTPGWLICAGLASRAATVIAIHAAEQGIELTDLEVQAVSRPDSRGVFGLTETDVSAVCAGPRDVALKVRIAARGVSMDTLSETLRVVRLVGYKTDTALMRASPREFGEPPASWRRTRALADSRARTARGHLTTTIAVCKDTAATVLYTALRAVRVLSGAYCPSGPRGEIGRRNGLKIRRP